jgi:hypothetical protein
MGHHLHRVPSRLIWQSEQRVETEKTGAKVAPNTLVPLERLSRRKYNMVSHLERLDEINLPSGVVKLSVFPVMGK